MIVAMLGIINPGRDQQRMFDHAEGKLIHDYFIFSVYQQKTADTIKDNGTYLIYKRYIGVGMNFYEISPIKKKAE